MGWEDVGMLDAWTWGILHTEYVRPQFQQMVISGVRERPAEAGHARAEHVEDLLPRWEQICSAN